MPFVSSYAHLTSATVPNDSWEEAWFAIEGWKGYLQSFPGMQKVRIAARKHGENAVRLHVSVSFEYAEQLDEWVQGPWTAGKILASLEPPATEISDELLEELS